MFRFIADESVSKNTIRMLKDLGHNIVNVYETELNGADDVEIINYAITNNRIVLTLDKDFAELYYFASEEKFGVILIRTKPQTVEIVNEIINNFLKERIPDDIDIYKTLIVLTRKKVRYHYKEN